MQASSLTSRIVRGLAFRDWAWWDLKPRLRLYVAAPPLVALVVIGILATRTDWRLADVGTFLLLMCCGAISVGSTPRIMYATGGTDEGFQLGLGAPDGDPAAADICGADPDSVLHHLCKCSCIGGSFTGRCSRPPRSA